MALFIHSTTTYWEPASWGCCASCLGNINKPNAYDPCLLRASVHSEINANQCIINKHTHTINT